MDAALCVDPRVEDSIRRSKVGDLIIVLKLFFEFLDTLKHLRAAGLSIPRRLVDCGLRGLNSGFFISANAAPSSSRPCSSSLYWRQTARGLRPKERHA